MLRKQSKIKKAVNLLKKYFHILYRTSSINKDNSQDLHHYQSPQFLCEYMTKKRWNSFFHQIDEIISDDVDTVLEVGVGTGFLGLVLVHLFHFKYNSIDTREDLHPDFIGSVLDMPFPDDSYDVVCCFQVLEHLPFKDFERALSEICRVARKKVIISLPNAAKLLLPSIPHIFDGDHYWEINKIGFSLKKIKGIIRYVGSLHCYELEKDYRVKEQKYHHFFVLKKETAH